jgi:hypothetical protein
VAAGIENNRGIISLGGEFSQAQNTHNPLIANKRKLLKVLFSCVISFCMDVTKEMDVINKIVKDLTPLEFESRRKVIDVVCKILDIDQSHPSAQVRGDVRQLPPTGTPQPGGKPTSPQQYLRNYNYKIMTKRIGVIAVYLERERKMNRFSLRDITGAFRDAKESKPPAHSQYARAVAMDYLGKEGDQYYATSKAEGLVDAYNKRQTDEAGAEE